MKLNEKAFANAAGLLTAIIYVVFYLIQRFAEATFDFLFNAQFLGANVAELVPSVGGRGFIPILITAAISAWVFSYIFAWIYNKLVS